MGLLLLVGLSVELGVVADLLVIAAILTGGVLAGRGTHLTIDVGARRALVRLLLVAGILTVAVSVLRVNINQSVYAEGADAISYWEAGQAVMRPDGEPDSSFVKVPLDASATGRVVLLVAGGQMLGMTVVGLNIAFGFTALIGKYLCALSLVRVGGWRPILVGTLLMASPTTLYWGGAISKDSLVILGIGIVALNISRPMIDKTYGVLFGIGLGVLLIASVRLHIAVLVGGSAALAFLLHWRADRHPVAKSRVWLAAVVLTASVTLAAPQLLIRVLPVDDGGANSGDAAEVLDDIQARRTTGGSSFQALSPFNPNHWPALFPTALLRPYPWEAAGLLQLAQASETWVYAGIYLMLVRRRAKTQDRLPGGGLRLMTFSALISVGAVMFLPALGNLGTLSRQRSQFVPIFLMIAFTAGQREVRQIRERPAVLWNGGQGE